jgi:hypothetical protein
MGNNSLTAVRHARAEARSAGRVAMIASAGLV